MYLRSKLEEVCKTYEAELGIDRREFRPFLLGCLKSMRFLYSGPASPSSSSTSTSSQEDSLSSAACSTCTRWWRFLNRRPTRLSMPGRAMQLIVTRLSAFVEATRIVVYTDPDDERLSRFERPDKLAALYFVPKLLEPEEKPLSRWPINGGKFSPLTALSCVRTALLKLIQNKAGVYWNQLI